MALHGNRPGHLPAGTILKPIYRKTAAFGHFGRDEFSWEKTDRVTARSSAA